MNSQIIDLLIVISLCFGICLVRGIVSDARGNWSSWWKRPAMFIDMLAMSGALVAISVLCIVGIGYAKSCQHGLLIMLPCMAVLCLCCLSLIVSLGMAMVMPFVDDMELD